MNKTKLNFYWLTAFILFFIMVVIDAILRFDFFYTLPEVPYRLTIMGLELFVAILSIWTIWKYGNKEIFRFQFKPSYIAYFFLFFILILVWDMLVVLYFPRPENQTALIESYSPYVQILEILFILSTVVVGPVVEEIVYRGIVMTALSSLKKYYIDVIGSAFLFALSHVLWQGLIITDFIAYFIPGLLFALYYRKTDYCIYYPIILHAFLNWLPELLS